MGEGSTSSWEEGVPVHGRIECQFMGGGSTSSWEEGVPVYGRREGQSKTHYAKQLVLLIKILISLNNSLS